jgi:RHS repeat-associated protein
VVTTTPPADATAPSVPSALAGTVKSGSEIDLSWAASTDATAVAGYKVYRDGTLLATVGSTSWFDTALAGGSTHTYEVSAVDAAGNESARSASVSKTTTSVAPADTVAPTTPAGVTAATSAWNAATITWSASADNIAVTSYTIIRNGTPISKVAGTTTSFTDATTAASAAYAYTVTASDAAGNMGAPSSPALVTTPDPLADTVKPSVPAGLTATSMTKKIDLTWSASTDDNALAGYKISRDGTLIATSYSPAYSDLNLAAGTAHIYTVSAFDGDGNTSDPSTAATARVKTPPPPQVTYSYDLADRLTAVTTASGMATLFTIDALGRHASRTTGTTPTESYSYLGSSNTVIGITSTTATTTSAIDAVGNRVATTGGGAVGFLLPDLHGNTAGALNSAATTITDAFAYDAYGNTVASVTSALPTPWRYQGRILESAAGTPDLYDFGARSYNPTLGAFTSLDTLHGSAQNPALLNGYLYANANPATLVDPDGHCASSDGWNGCIGAPQDVVGDVARTQNNVQAASKAAAKAASIADDRSSMSTAAYRAMTSNNRPQKLTLGNGVGVMKGQDRRCDGAVGCFTDFLGGSAKTIGGVITNPATLLCAAAVAGTVASGGTLVAVAAGVCLGAAYANLGKQGADYANDLGKHNWNPVDTAADGWAPYQNAIDTNRYDKLGQMTTGTALTWGGDALLIYGGIRGVQGASGGGEAPVVPTSPYARPVGATTAAQRASVQGLPCVDCGGIAPTQVADHIHPLVQQWYETGTIDLQVMRSLEAVQPQCPLCSAVQGGQLSWYSRAMRAKYFGDGGK